MPPRHALSRRIRKVGAAVRAGLFLVLALIALTLAAPKSASADFACDFTGDESYHKDSPGSNGEGFIPMVLQWGSAPFSDLKSEQGLVPDDYTVESKDASRYTLYELNGMRGLNWSMTFKGKGNASQNNGDYGSGADDCEVMAYVNNGVANAVFYGTKVLTRFSISVKEMASNPSPFAGLYKGRDSAVTTLKTHLLRPAVPVMIVLVGLWVFTKWRKGDMREVWAGISWTALSTIAVMAVLAGTNYDKFVSGADKWIAEANSTLTSNVLSGVSGTPQPPCDLTDDRGAVGLRLSSCAMYDTLAFRPWALGQFGEPGNTCIFRINRDGTNPVKDVCPETVPSTILPDSPVTKYDCYWGTPGSPRCADLRVRQAVTQSTTNIDATREKVDKFVEWQAIRKNIAVSEDAPDKSIYPVAFDDWTGKNATDRVGIAFYSLVAAFIVGVMVLVLSALTLLWHAVTLILIIMLPLVATIGIHPSQQKLLKGWLETFVHSFVLRAGFGVILTVLLVLYQIILPAQIALGTQLLMLVLVTAAVVMMLKKLLAGNFSPEFAGGGGDALGIREAAGAGSDKVVAKGEAAVANTTKATGRVVGKTAAGAANLLTGRKGRQALQKRGWIGMSQREQRKASYAAYKSGQDQLKGKKDASPTEAEPAQSPPPASSSRGGRVSGSAGQSSSQAPQTPSTQQASQTESSQTSQQTQDPKPQPAATRPRTQAPEPSPAPRPSTPPTPAPRDPRTPDGRVQ